MANFPAIARRALALTAAALALNVASARASGPAATPEIQTFCADPRAAICGAQNELAQARDDRANATNGKIRGANLRALAIKYGFSPADDDGYDQFAETHPELADAMLKDFVRGMQAGAVREIGKEPLVWQKKTESQIQAQLLKTIDAQSSLNTDQKTLLKTSLGKLNLVDVTQVMAHPEADPDVYDKFVYQCSKSGLRDNAFQPPETHNLVLCPGLILSARPDSNQTAATQEMFAGVVWTMAHETGHTIDSENFVPEHRALRACVDENFGRQGVLGGLKGLTPGTSSYEQGLDPYMEEISADSWANETLARLMEAMPDRVQALHLLQASTVGLCSLRDDGKRHPSAEFRLGVLLGRNPRIRHALGCAPLPQATPVCVFEGKDRRTATPSEPRPEK
jgi:hypothetical protein